VTRVVFSIGAYRDLQEIADYIAQDNPLAARNLVRELRDSCGLLRTLPMMGRARPDAGPDMRSFTHRSDMIYYRYRAALDRADIVRIWHGRRLPPTPADLN
jgi:toxin ParE1/3/4